MEYIVLGTAGHIDHGKTSLVKALTGIDTDRLKEEKERGITIDLGFAYMPLPSGITLSIIDVPGHERFVKNMVAGASGIDMVLLVVAADDGIMPQTREHMEICSLLGVRHGLVAVTKSDLVDAERLSYTIGGIRGFLKGSFLEGAPIIPVSPVTGNGTPELISAIDSIAIGIRQRAAEGIFRLPVDRAFTVKGFGTVVTGTVVSGKVRVGEEVEILPKGIRSKVRGVQVHGRQVEEGIAGSRAALNLQGVDKEAVARGDTITAPGTLKAAETLEVMLSLLPSAARPLRDGAEPILHIYSASAPASVALLDSKEIRPGESRFARVRTKSHVVAVHGDRFVLRTNSGTIGGGTVLDAGPPRRGRKEALEEAGILYSGGIKDKILLLVKRVKAKGIAMNELSLKLNIPMDILAPSASELVSTDKVLAAGGILLSVEAVKDAADSIASVLGDYHKKEPLKAGMAREGVRTRLSLSSEVLHSALGRLINDGIVSADGDTVRLSSHRVPGGGARDRIEKIYSDSWLTPPTLAELSEQVRIKERDAADLLNLLSREGVLVKVKDLFFHRKAIEGLKTKVTGFFNTKNEMTPVEFKELTGLSRKFAIPLLEYLDSQKVTIRVGDVRRLRKASGRI